METKDYSQFSNISLEDSGLFSNYDLAVLKLLNRNGIKNVAQLLMIDSSNGFSGRFVKNTAAQLRGMIELIKYKYLNEPFVVDAYLDDHFTMTTYTYTFKQSPDFRVLWGNINLSRLGFNPNEISILQNYVPTVYKEGMTLIDFFREYSQRFEKRNTTYKTDEKINLYIDSYNVNKAMETELSKKATEEEKEIQYSIEVQSLKTLLSSLIDTRDKLNITIADIETQLNELQSKGAKK